MRSLSKIYYFYLSPEVYFTKEGTHVLLYGTSDGKKVESDYPECGKLIERLYKYKSKGRIKIDFFAQKDSESLHLRRFVNEIIKSGLGSIVPAGEKNAMKANFLPILNLQNDVDKLKKERDSDLGGDILQYLNELNLILNEECDGSCPYCSMYCKQTLSCRKGYGKKYLSLSRIKALLDELEYAPLQRINLLGGNILLYPELSSLLSLFKASRFDVHYWMHVNHVEEFPDGADGTKDIIVNFPINKEKIKSVIFSNKKREHTVSHFFVENDEQFEICSELIKNVGIVCYDLRPIYTGNNIDFFERNVFLDREDVFSSLISQRLIFCNQKLNYNHFGKLFILPNGSIRANMNGKSLGNLYGHSLLEMIYNELERNTAWRRIRTGPPCKACMYKYLCPPPSNYETVMKRNNLCYIK